LKKRLYLEFKKYSVTILPKITAGLEFRRKEFRNNSSGMIKEKTLIKSWQKIFY